MRLLATVLLLSMSCGLAAQPTPTFDAISIKRHVGGDRGGFGPPGPGHFRATNINFLQVISAAWEVPMGLGWGIKGAPSWFVQDTYDVEMVWPADTPTTQVREMWRAMFADRMKLAAHYETIDDPSFELVVARADGVLGPALKRSTVDCDAVGAAQRAGTQPAVLPNGAGPCAMKMSGDGFIAGGIPMSQLAPNLTGPAGRQVIDKTGLEGRWEFVLQFSRFEMNPDAIRGPYPLLEEALQKQLGLKLVPVVAKSQLLVIDHVERPTEN